MNKRIAKELKRIAMEISAMGRNPLKKWDVRDEAQAKEVVRLMREFVSQVESDLKDLDSSSLMKRLYAAHTRLEELRSSGKKRISTEEGNIQREISRLRKAIDAGESLGKFDKDTKVLQTKYANIFTSAYEVNNVIKSFAEHLSRSEALAAEISSTRKSCWKKVDRLKKILSLGDENTISFALRMSEREDSQIVANAELNSQAARLRIKTAGDEIISESRNVLVALVSSENKVITQFKLMAKSIIGLRDRMNMGLELEYGAPGRYQPGKDPLPLDGPGLRASVGSRSLSASNREAGLMDVFRSISDAFKSAFSIAKEFLVDMFSVGKEVKMGANIVADANEQLDDASIILANLSDLLDEILAIAE